MSRLQNAATSAPPFPPLSRRPLSPTFGDSVRLDDAAGAVGCTDGRVGGAGAHSGREEEFQLLDKQQEGEKNNGLNND